MRARVQDRVDAIARRLGQLDAHIIRIDALGKRLTTMANVDRRSSISTTSPRSRRPQPAVARPLARYRISVRSYRSWNNGLTCAMRSCRRWRT